MTRAVLHSWIVFMALVLHSSIAPAHAQSREQFFEQLDAQMKQGIPSDEPGAVIAVAREGEVLFRRAYGKASLELDVDLTPEHSLCLASATKPFTATAVMALVEDGALQLDGSASDLLADVQLDPRITIEHLLSHTSGLPDLFDLDGYGEDAQHKAITPEALCAAADGAELLFEPGTQHRYSNLAYALLGRIVEVKSGESLESFLKKRIFERAGMKSTMFGGDRLIVPGAVSNYVESGDGGWRCADPLNYSWGFGLGGLFSTIDDLVAFDTALRAGKILKPETVQRMEQAFVLPTGEAGEHGLGWVTMERRGMRFVSHGGGIGGWRAFMVAIPDRRIFVAILSNRGEERTPVGSIGLFVAAQLAAMPK